MPMRGIDVGSSSGGSELSVVEVSLPAVTRLFVPIATICMWNKLAGWWMVGVPFHPPPGTYLLRLLPHVTLLGGPPTRLHHVSRMHPGTWVERKSVSFTSRGPLHLWDRVRRNAPAEGVVPRTLMDRVTMGVARHLLDKTLKRHTLVRCGGSTSRGSCARHTYQRGLPPFCPSNADCHFPSIR